MRVIDISVELDENTKIYAGDPEYLAKPYLTTKDDGYNVSVISMGTHTGTHIDAPYHYFQYGKKVNQLPLELFFGKCIVSENIIKCERLLLKGKNSVSEAEARKIIELDIRLIGIEGMTIGNDDVHRRLLDSEIVILENVDLSKVETGEYMLACPPLKINEDGSPVRACLIEV